MPDLETTVRRDALIHTVESSDLPGDVRRRLVRLLDVMSLADRDAYAPGKADDAKWVDQASAWRFAAERYGELLTAATEAVAR